jgi:glutamate racemase
LPARIILSWSTACARQRPWPVDWIDPAEAIARRALSLLDGSREWRDDAGRDIAVFTSKRTDFATRRLMQGFGLTVEGT